MKSFENGIDHLSHRYWTKDSLGEPMLAEQHVVMYRDLVSNDLLAITYILDLTKIEELREKDARQRRLLEEDIKKIEGLASQYSALYFIDFETKECERYYSSENVPRDNIEIDSKNLDSYLNMFRE